MRRLLLGAVAVIATLPYAPAAHASPGGNGLLCGTESEWDPQVEGSRTGELRGGPLILSNETRPPVFYTGQLVCTIQTGVNDTHAEQDTAFLRGARNTGVAIVAGNVTYEVGVAEDIYVCTQVNFDGFGPRYYDRWSGWTTDPGAACLPAYDARSTARNTGCSALAGLFPPEGDVVVFDTTVVQCP